MKDKLLPLLLVMGMYKAHSQVVIGILTPESSAQLEVCSTDKGILIPQVKLQSSIDTIINGNINSLLVFNTATSSDISPGYYYWYADKWLTLGTSTDSGSGAHEIAGENGLRENNV